MEINQTSAAWKLFGKKCVQEKGMLAKEEIEALFEKIYKTIPQDILPTLGETVEDQVLGFWDSYWLAVDGHKPGTPDAPQLQPTPAGGKTRTPSVEFTPPAGPGVYKDMEEMVQADWVKRQQTTDTSAIVKLLRRFPDMTTFLTGKQVIPVMSQKAIDKYTENLVDTPENKAAFDTALKAIQGATLVPVDPEDKNVRIEGVKVRKLAAGQSQSAEVTEVYSNSELLAFLIAETTLRLGTVQSPIGVGAKYKKFNAVNSKGRASTEQNYGKPVMTLVGKKQAMENFPDAVEIISQVNEASPTDKKKVRTTLSFKIYTGDPDSTGQRKQKAVRVTGWLNEFPNYEIMPQYQDHFQSAQRNVVSTQLTTAEKDDTAKVLTALSVAAAQNQIVGINMSAFGADFINRVKQNAEKGKAADAANLANMTGSAK